MGMSNPCILKSSSTQSEIQSKRDRPYPSPLTLIVKKSYTNGINVEAFDEFANYIHHFKSHNKKVNVK